jgi:hypothetical protein
MQTETTAVDTTTTAAPADATTTTEPAAPASAAPADGVTDEGTSTTTAPAGEEDGTQQDADRKDNGQFKSGAQKRIDALVFQRHQAEREAAYWKQQAQATQQAPAAAPKVADFDSYDEYEHAMQQYRIDDGVNRGLAKTAEQHAERFSQQAQSATAETYNQRAKEAVARIPDFVEVVSKSDVPMSPALQEALMDSERGPELVYHLAKNPAEAERLNNMSVRQMDREIGRLESTFGTKPAAPPPPAARTTSAPAPIKPGNPASAPANTDPNRMNQGEFEAWAKANGSKYIR